MDGDRTAVARPTKRRRQDPVSCRLCRVKKLKCDRQYPCSNCTARSTICEFEPSQTYQLNTKSAQEGEPTNAAILARLSRLEDMIARLDRTEPATPDSTARKECFSASITSPLSEFQESQSVEPQSLDRLATYENNVSALFANECVYEIVPLSQIANHELPPPKALITRILLPTHGEGLLVFERFKQYVSYYHHIAYMPTLESQIKGIYKALAEGNSPDVAHVTLLLTVLATVLYYTKFLDDDLFPETQSASREKTFMLCFRSALDLLDHSRRLLSASLAVVQSAIILVFLDFNLEGLTPRARALLLQAISTARDLGMHRVDCASHWQHSRPQSLELMIDIEMQRRIWWHLVATDWMLALSGSPAEGTYTIHPNQHRVNIPRNLDDNSFSTTNLSEDLPLSVPTCMSYSLQRIRLAHITRHVIDEMQYGLADPLEYDYSRVYDLDRELEKFLDDLPVFLKVDNESVKRSSFILEKYPYFAMQRYIINIGAQSLRCKLHQPFMVRASSKDAKMQADGRRPYQDSIDKCMEAAMAVVKINQAIRDDPVQSIPARVKLTGLLHHMFLATIVLVMDLVRYQPGEDNREARAPQVMHCIQMLEDAKRHSTAVHKFLDSLMDALKKHKIRLDSPAAPRQISDIILQSAEGQNELDDAARVLAGMPSGLPVLGSSRAYTNLTPASTPAVPVELEAGQQRTPLSFDELWKDGVGGDAGIWGSIPDWDQLFTDLDAFIA